MVIMQKIRGFVNAKVYIDMIIGIHRYVCLYICMYIVSQSHTHTHTHIYIYIYVCVCVCVCVIVPIYT